jgi:hypothetical protein
MAIILLVLLLAIILGGKYKDLITEPRREETGHGEMRPRRFAAGRLPVLVSRLA